MTESDINLLLKDVKGYLKISWVDEGVDAILSGFIKRGGSYLQNIAGADLNFMEESLPKQLLSDYCRYANSQALEMFAVNFRSELSELHYSTQASLVILDEVVE